MLLLTIAPHISKYFSRGVLLAALLIGCLVYSFGQKRYLDSLHHVVQHSAKDSARLRAMSRLIIAYEDSAPYKALNLAEKALALTRDMKSLYLEAILHNQNGAVLMSMGQFEEAQYHFLQADSLYRKEGREDKLGDVYLNLGSVMGQQGRYQQARKYIRYAIEQYDRTGDQPRVGVAQGHMGLSYVYEDSLKKGVYFLRRAYQKAVDLGIPQLQSNPVTNLGFAYLKLGKYDSALYWIAKAHILCDSLGARSDCLTNLNNEASVYEGQGLYAKSIQTAKNGIDMAETWGFASKRLDLLNTLHIAQSKAGQYTEAYKTLLQFNALKDSLFEIRQTEKIAELDARFLNQQQLFTIESLEQEQQASSARNRILLSAAAIVIALLGLVAFFARRSAIQRRKANALLQGEATQLKALDETKSRFFANLAHELRTPLTLVLGPLKEAQNRPVLKEDTTLRKQLHLAQQNTHKLLGLVNEIMDLSSLEAGKMSLNLSTFKLQEVLRRCFFSFESGAEIDNVRLLVEDQLPEALWIRADSGKLETIITNLVSNALKHSDKGGRITLSMELGQQADRVIIRVADNGTGIPPEDLPHVFDRYFQSHSTDAPLRGGTGIGLALTRELVHLMKGTISVTSEPGNGSTFKVVLPIERTEAQIQVPPKPNNNVQSFVQEDSTTHDTLRLSDARILVVEDNAELASFIVDLLKEQYHTLSARDGIEALEILKSEEVDLVLSDVMMPRMDGFKLMETIKSNVSLRHLPTILLTARAQNEDKLLGLRIGVDDYMTKPFNAEELKARIVNLLQNKAARKEAIQVETHTPEAQLPSHDESLLSKAEAFVIENIDSSKLKVSDLANELSVSERQVYRVIRQLTGLSPVHFIREIRLRKARTYLEGQTFSSVADVAYQTGFENPSYFSRLYQERYGIKPSEVLKQ